MSPVPRINILEAKAVLYALDLLATTDTDPYINYRYQFRIDNTTAIAVIQKTIFESLRTKRGRAYDCTPSSAATYYDNRLRGYVSQQS
jgi:hypothetical protein